MPDSWKMLRARGEKVRMRGKVEKTLGREYNSLKITPNNRKNQRADRGEPEAIWVRLKAGGAALSRPALAEKFRVKNKIGLTQRGKVAKLRRKNKRKPHGY
jgi:hypothetical protein